MATVKCLDFLTIDLNNVDEGVKQLLHEIRPTWKWSNVEQKALSGGYSCLMLRYFEKANKDDSITIRIQKQIFFDKETTIEVKVLKHLSQIGYFPNLLATFTNGYCYQYIKGKPAVNLATGEITLHDTMLKASAHKMAVLHTISIPDIDMKAPKFFSSLKTMLINSAYEPPTPVCPTKEVLLNECSVLEQFCTQIKARVGLCHGDTHPGNMVWNEKNETITFVDWELVHVGYQYNDIAHFLAVGSTLWASMLPLFNSNLDTHIFPRDTREKFCRFYYEEWCRLQSQSFTETEFESLLKNVDTFKMCDAFLFIMLNAIIPEENWDVIKDYKRANFLEMFTKYYLQLKERFIGRKDFG